MNLKQSQLDIAQEQIESQRQNLKVVIGNLQEKKNQLNLEKEIKSKVLEELSLGRQQAEQDLLDLNDKYEMEKQNFENQIQKMEEEYEAIFDSNVKQLEKYEKHLEIGVNKGLEIEASIKEFREEIFVVQEKIKNNYIQ